MGTKLIKCCFSSVDSRETPNIKMSDFFDLPVFLLKHAEVGNRNGTYTCNCDSQLVVLALTYSREYL